MNTIPIHKKDTFYADPMVMEYLEGDKLSPFYDLAPSADSYAAAIANRKHFSQEKRTVLSQVLRDQYQRSDIDLKDSKVEAQIHALEKEGAFTVTTGQQIHVGLGPLYVLYKIVDVLRLAQDVQDHTGSRIVPVFWMASEDHDLDEIQSMRVFGKDFVWETSQKGAVGRMETDGLQELVESIRSQFRWDEEHLAFLELLITGYGQQNYADATRYVLHQLFGQHGLVILDGDDPRLKMQFKEVMLNELKGEHIPFFNEASQKLKEMGYRPQIHIHSCNLFHIGPDYRQKLENQEDRSHKGRYIPNEQVDAWMDTHCADCSPNVALRPLYQETILPNLIYVGGNAEMKYWLQLKPIFKNYAQSMPILWPRTSYVVLPNATHKMLDSKELDKNYLDVAAFSAVIEQDLANKRSELHNRLDHIQAEFVKYASDFEALVKGVNVQGRVAKMSSKVSELQAFTDDRIAELMRNDPRLKKALKLKDRFFNAQFPQERTEHWISYPQLGEDLMCQEKWIPKDNLLNINHLLL